MTRSLYTAAPLRFLVGVTLVWTVARGATLMGWQPDDRTDRAPAPAPAEQAMSVEPVPAGVRPVMPDLLAWSHQAPTTRPVFLRQTTRRDRIAMIEAVPADVPLAREAAADVRHEARPETQALLPAAHGPSRFSGSAWAFVRGGGMMRGIAPNGQIGGGQAGARLLYRLAGLQDFAVSARISKAIGGPRQTEAALGFDWKPIRALPVHLMIERRFAIDKGGRNAWMAGLAGGVYAVPVAPGWRLDGYGEAGVVGMRSHDVFADGAVRVARQIDLGPGRSLALGAGAWGAMQPGAKRLDVGPSAVVRLPVARKTMAFSLDWRERVAGKARPGSGPAFTAGFDF